MLTTFPVVLMGIWMSAGLFMMAMACNLYRIVIGPSLADRIAALDSLSINAIGPILLLGMNTGQRSTIDAAILVALLGFLSTAALCKYLLRGMIIE